MLGEFKSFLKQHNVVGLAVAVVIGGAVGKLVTALVADLIMPIIGALTPQQKVELFRIVTGADYKDMLALGVYSFYRVGIGPDGAWHFFVAGD